MENRFGDAGLLDLFIEAGIVAARSVYGVVEDREKKQAIRAHKIVMEAMQRLRLKSFKEWMDEDEKDAYLAVADEMDTVCTDTTSDALGVLLTSPKFQLLLELFRATYHGKMAFIHRTRLPAAAIYPSKARGKLESAHVLHP